MSNIVIDDCFLKNVILHHSNVDKNFLNKGIGANIEVLKDLIVNYVNSKEDNYVFNILEIGTLRSNPNVSTHHKDIISNIKLKPNQSFNYIMSDIEPGLDVDVVCDVHKLSNKFKNLDFIITFSGYEHFKYPQLASHEILKCLKKDGIVFIQSHQSFPLHGYPCDYFRFSLDAYESCFPKTMYCELIGSEYTIPVFIRPHSDKHWMQWNQVAKSFANSSAIFKKTSDTPITFQYDI